MKQHLVTFYISIALLQNPKGPIASISVLHSQIYLCGKAGLAMPYLLVVMCNFCIMI